MNVKHLFFVIKFHILLIARIYYSKFFLLSIFLAIILDTIYFNFPINFLKFYLNFLTLVYVDHFLRFSFFALEFFFQHLKPRTSMSDSYLS